MAKTVYKWLLAHDGLFVSTFPKAI